MIPTDDSTFRHLVEQAPDGHFILVDGTFTYLNIAARIMFGWNDEAPEGLTVLDVVHPGDHERCKRNILLRQSGALRGASSYRGLRRTGEVFPIEVHTATMGAGGTVALHGIVRDLSDRKEMEDALVRTEQSSLTARLVEGVSHDLSDLLTIIQTSADLLEKQDSAVESSEGVAQIRKALTLANRKLAQMKDLSLTQIAEQESRPLWVNRLVDDVLNLTQVRWKNEAARAGVEYNLSWRPGNVEPVLAGSADLRAALVALVFNALESMPDGGCLSLETGMTPEGEVRITVSDEGGGLEEPTIEDLSDVFFTTQPGQKMGLGLQLVRRVVEAAHGRLEVASTLGKGSNFSLLFPPSPERPVKGEGPLRLVDEGWEGVDSVPTSSRPKTVGARRVLLVDDQSDLVQVLRTILEQKGFDVDVALRARHGLGFVEALKYSVILTDLGLPDMSGWDFAAQAKKLQEKTPIIMMTGWAVEIEEQRLADEGIYALLPKPFSGKQLLDLIADALESRRQASQSVRN